MAAGLPSGQLAPAEYLTTMNDPDRKAALEAKDIEYRAALQRVRLASTPRLQPLPQPLTSSPRLQPSPPPLASSPRLQP